MIKPKFMGQIRDGEFVVCIQQDLQRKAYLEGFGDGEVVEEIIQKPTESKTLQQLRYAHGVVFKIASEASGYTVEETKGLLKQHFLRRYIESPEGKTLSYVPSLADLKIGDMAEFIDNCVILIASHWHAVVPPPENVDLENT